MINYLCIKNFLIFILSLTKKSCFCEQSLKRDFPKLDVFTFIGVSWSGALALLLAQLLEAEKKQVTLILIDAAPDPVQNWVKTLIDDLDSNLITKYFTLNQKVL